jgi:hydrogenase nickel incorporation protein HypB
LRFNEDYFRRGVEMLNPGLAFFPLSCETGVGLDRWTDWLRKRVTRSPGGKERRTT